MHHWWGGGINPCQQLKNVVIHVLLGQLFEPKPMEKDSSPLDLYKGVTEDSMFYAFELTIEHNQL